MDERLIDALIETWFGPTGVPSASHQEMWWRKDPSFDASLGQRFGADIDRAAAGDLDDWATTPRGALALVLLLDQLPRNVFRDTPRSFATDEKARGVCGAALAAGHDAHLPLHQRAFLAMPFMHSESLADQDAGIGYFDSLVARAEQPDDVKGFADFGRQHRNIVARFGRFPHRNVILGRPSTEEELAFLKTPGSSF